MNLGDEQACESRNDEEDRYDYGHAKQRLLSASALVVGLTECVRSKCAAKAGIGSLEEHSADESEGESYLDVRQCRSNKAH